MKQQKVIFKGYNLGPRRQILHVLSHMWILVSIIIYVYLYGNKCTRSLESKKKYMAGEKIWMGLAGKQKTSDIKVKGVNWVGKV